MPFNRKDQATFRQNDETPSVIKREKIIQRALLEIDFCA